MCDVIDVQSSKSYSGVIFLRIRYKGKEAWALDSYCIKVKKYDIIYDESIKRACDQLQRHEEICKKLRDDILRDVFSEPEKEDEEICTNEEEQEEQLFSEWEDVKTKECIPLPGKGSSMIDTTSFIPTEWMTDDELDEYYEGLMEEND